MTITDGHASPSPNLQIGSPLHTSSPATVNFCPGSPEGDGDNRSIRFVHNMPLSPICKAMEDQQIISTMVESPRPTSPPTPPATAVPVNSFLNNFEKSLLEKKPRRPYSLEQELLLTEKISGMKPEEAKALLAKVLIDNLALRQELRTKQKRLTTCKGKMLAFMDWRATQELDITEHESSGHNTKATKTGTTTTVNINSDAQGDADEKIGIERKLDKNMVPQKTFHSSQEFTMVEEVNGITRSLSLFQEFASSIDVDQELLKDRLKEGCYLTNQLLLGGIAGWISALFIKKFGKLALSAAGGGLILLVYTTRKGFVNVNYDSIYQEMSKFCDNGDVTNNYNCDLSNANSSGSFNKSRESVLGVEGVNSNRSGEDLPIADVCQTKLQQVKKWITSHTYTVGGFVLTFVYNLI